MIREAVILSGGFGTRLKKVAEDIPKSMVMIGNRPFLDYLLEHLHMHNIKKVILAVGYKNKTIISYFGNSYKESELVYSIEDEPLGTGGALLKAADLISSDRFFVINGDTYFDVDFDKFEKSYNRDSILSIALKPMTNFDRYGSIITKGKRITAFNEKKYCKKGLINGGIYLISKSWLIQKAPGRIFSFERDLIEKSVNEDSITSFISDTYFIDIGIPDDYVRASKELPKLIKLTV
jgi:D-glycero-alpha-D-manno-heptose 1-phosphate guanylyltransferase